MMTEILLKHPNVTLEYAVHCKDGMTRYADHCKDGMTRKGTFEEILNKKLAYLLKVGDRAGFLQSPYIETGAGHLLRRKYPIIPSTVVKEITGAGVLFADFFGHEPDVFVPYEDLLIKPVDTVRCKCDLRRLLNGTLPTQEYDEKRGRYIDLPVFSEHWPRDHRLDSNLQNFRITEEQLTFFE
jgi:hypothetical protein